MSFFSVGEKTLLNAEKTVDEGLLRGLERERFSSQVRLILCNDRIVSKVLLHRLPTQRIIESRHNHGLIENKIAMTDSASDGIDSIEEAVGSIQAIK